MKIGQHLVLGFEGTSPSDDFLRLLKEEEIGGVILFKRNVENRKQVRDLITTLKEARGAPLLVSVDHEGGRVFRLPAPFTELPPAREFGLYYERTQDHALIEAIAELIAVELKSVGFNLNYAPVLDIDTCPENPIIGDRAFHQDPSIVAEVACAFIRGFERADLISCGKHFPGHGDTREDSHLTLPRVDTAETVLRERELQPFRMAIANGVPTLMTAHVLYSALDEACCGTLSQPINNDLLRDELGFEGVLFSDDLFMKGIAADSTHVPVAALQSIRAGCDMLLLCHDEAAQRETIAQLKAAGDLADALKRSAPRVARLQRRLEHLESEPRQLEADADRLSNKLAELS